MLANWYISQRDREQCAKKKVRERFRKDSVGAFINISHLNRLNCTKERRKSKETIRTRLQAVVDNHNGLSFDSFEELYSFIYNEINMPEKVKFVGHVAIYDISLRFGYVCTKPTVKPKDYVYLHGPVLQAFEYLFPDLKGKTCMHPADNHLMIPSVLLQKNFPGFHSSEIEDLFCFVGKCVSNPDINTLKSNRLKELRSILF